METTSGLRREIQPYDGALRMVAPRVLALGGELGDGRCAPSAPKHPLLLGSSHRAGCPACAH